jgi:hypothetical protein
MSPTFVSGSANFLCIPISDLRFGLSAARLVQHFEDAATALKEPSTGHYAAIPKIVRCGWLAK